MILTDKDIQRLCLEEKMIFPFSSNQIKTLDMASGDQIRIPSAGLSSCGYDITLASEWKLAIHSEKPHDLLTDDKENWFEKRFDHQLTLKPGEFVLARTNEYFKMPKNICASLFCKSTIARCGIMMPPTWTEPGWEGHLVVEIYNVNPFPIIIHSHVGMGQMIFFELTGEPIKPYGADRKYQGQTGVTVGKL